MNTVNLLPPGVLPLQSILFNDKVLQLIIELVCALFAVIGKLDGLTEVKAEDTENRLAVYLVLAGFQVNVTLKSNEDVDQLINIVDLFEFNVKSHNFISFPGVAPKTTL